MIVDAKMNNNETLLKNLKNKISFELQKIMILKLYKSTNLYTVAKKCQFIDQTLKNINNRVKYTRKNNEENNIFVTTIEEIMFAINKNLISIVVNLSLRLLTEISISRAIVFASNQFRAFNQQILSVS